MVETSEAQEKKDVWYVRKSYVKGLVGAVFLAFFAWSLASWINSFHLLTTSLITFIQIGSIIPGATALYGQRGWKIQTWGGATEAERVNKSIYNFLASVGFFLAVFAFLLEA